MLLFLFRFPSPCVAMRFYGGFHLVKDEQLKVRIVPIGKMLCSLKEEKRAGNFNKGSSRKEFKKYTSFVPQSVSPDQPWAKGELHAVLKVVMAPQWSLASVSLGPLFGTLQRAVVAWFCFHCKRGGELAGKPIGLL